MKPSIRNITWLLFSLFFSLAELVAQSPTHIDTRKKDPKPFTLDDILVYIVFPVLLFLGIILAQRYQKKLREKKMNKEE